MRAIEPARVRGAILAGGAARRFGGRPKGLELVGGIRILDRVVAALREATGEPPILIANQPDASGWHAGLRVVPDRIAEAGTLGGLHAAVVEAPAPVLCVAWDMPFVSAGLLRRLARGLGKADAVLPASGGRRGMEPLCAAYGPAVRKPIEAAIARGDFRAVAFHDQVRVDILSVEEVRSFGTPERLFFNVNTVDDLRTANAEP